MIIAKMVSETKRNLHHFFRFGSGVNGGLVGDTSLSRFERRLIVVEAVQMWFDQEHYILGHVSIFGYASVA